MADPDRLLRKYRRRYDEMLHREGQSSRRREARGFRRIREFDPQQYAAQAGRAIYENMAEDFGRQMRDLRSSQVATGRVRTGYAQEDERRAIEDFNEELARQQARLAQRAAGQELQAGRTQLNAGQRARQRYASLLAGGMDRAIARKNAEQREQSGLFGSIGGLVGGLAGNFLLPGIGAGAGAALGGAAGEAAAGIF